MLQINCAFSNQRLGNHTFQYMLHDVSPDFQYGVRFERGFCEKSTKILVNSTYLLFVVVY